MTIVLILCLSACGNDPSSDPSPAPTQHPATVPTITPGGITVDNLLTAMDTAWASSTSMRSTSWESGEGVTATPPAVGPVTIEVVVRPSSRHMIQTVGGEVVDEQIVVDGRVFMRGSLVPAAIAPALDTNTWVEIDPAAANSSSPVAGLISYLLSPLTSPVGAVSIEVRSTEAIPDGRQQVAGRDCQIHTFSGSGALTYELAVDSAGLPCRLVIEADGHASVTVYEFNLPELTIAPPSVATPSAT